MEQFYLMNKDKEMALVECGATSARIVEVYSFFPLMHKMYKSFKLWLVENRGIENDFARNLKRNCGRNIKDTFWFKAVGSELCWEDVSLFNPSNQENHILTKRSLLGPNEKFVTSHGGSSWIVKEWSAEEQNLAYAEHLAYVVGKKFGANVVPCNLFVQYGTIFTETEIFTNDSCIMVTLDEIFDCAPSFFKLFSFFKSLGKKFLNEFRKLMVFDALIVNTNRNLRNMGILLNPDTGDFLGIAPSYEHSRSLLSDVSEEQLENFEEKLKDTYFRWGDPNLVAAFCRTSDLESKLGDMLNFKFPFNLKDDRIATRKSILSSMIHYQVHNVLHGIANNTPSLEKTSLSKVLVEDESFSLEGNVSVDIIDNHEVHTLNMISKKTEKRYILEPEGDGYILEGDLLQFKVVGIERKKVPVKGLFNVEEGREIIDYGN